MCGIRSASYQCPIKALEIADAILSHPPEVGYLTTSNALQWRLQYIERAGFVSGIERLR